MFGYTRGFDNGYLDPFERLRRQVDSLFEGAGPGPTGIRSVAAGTFPAINVGVTPAQVDVFAFAAGVDPKSLDITIQQNLLTLAGERTVEQPEGAQYYRRERVGGSFRRVIELPEDVDPDRVDANYRDGVLHIKVGRREAVQPRQIKVS